MVILQQLVVGDVLADLDVEVELEVRPVEAPFEHPGHLLGAGMVGCDTGADESPRGRELLEHLDLDVRTFEQFTRRVAGRGAAPTTATRSVPRSRRAESPA